MTKGSTVTLTASAGKNGTGTLGFSVGPLVEPLGRARKWYADAWTLLDKAKATEEQISTIAKKWNGRNLLTSPYVWIEASNGEHPSWPNISATTFAVISACLLVETLRDMADAEKAGTANDLDSAIGLFWICRYAWNMSKATEVTPAAKKAALSESAKRAGGFGGKARSDKIEPARKKAMARFQGRARTEKKSRTLAEMEIASGLSRTTVSGIYSKGLEAEKRKRETTK